MPLLFPHVPAPAALSRRWESGDAGTGGRKRPLPSAAPAVPAAPGWPCPSFPSSQHQRLNKHRFFLLFLLFFLLFPLPWRCVRGGQRALGPGGRGLVALKSLLNHDLLFPSSVPASSNVPSVSLAAPMLKWQGFEVALPVVCKCRCRGAEPLGALGAAGDAAGLLGDGATALLPPPSVTAWPVLPGAPRLPVLLGCACRDAELLLRCPRCPLTSSLVAGVRWPSLSPSPVRRAGARPH